MTTFRGYEIEEINGKWCFCDSGALVSTYESRPCGYCNKHNTKEGHDACLGVLEGVMNACCGHGNVDESYVQFLDGSIVNGRSAEIVILKMKRKRKPGGRR